MSLKIRIPVCVLVLKACSHKAREDECSPRYLNCLIDQKHEKRFAIPFSDAVSKPWAMMIVSANTPLADLAMLRP